MAMNGLDKITDRILSEARADADRILADAQAECDRITADAVAKAEKIRDQVAGDAHEEGVELISRAKSSAAMQKRNRMLQAQSDLVDETFDTAVKAMLSLSTEKYTSLLAGLLAAAMTEQAETENVSRSLYGDEAVAPSEYEVLMNPSDRSRCGAAVIEQAKAKLKGKIPADRLALLRLSDRTVAIDGGLILRYGDIESNCSFALLFAQLRQELEADVSRALFENKGQF